MYIRGAYTGQRFKVKRPMNPWFSLQYIEPGDIYEAYRYCMRRKGGKKSTKVFESDLFNNLMKLHDEINSRTYYISPSKGFVITEPKVREVWCAAYRDRVVQHLIFNKIGRTFENSFIYDSYSCVKGKGTLCGGMRAAKFARSITNNWDPKHKGKAYYLKLDIASYFPSIDRFKLWEIMSKYFTNDSVIGYLLRLNIFNNFIMGADLNNPKMFELVPPHKSAFHSKPHCNLAIGNLLSQFASNVYLNELDQYVKHVLKVKYYGRYVDDMILMATSKEQLETWHQKIKEFLKEKLSLDLAEDKTIYGDIYKGFDFVGYIVKPFRFYIRKSTQNKVFAFIREYKKRKTLGMKELKELMSSLNSYMGLLKHTKSFNLRRKICSEVESFTCLRRKDDSCLSVYLDKDAARKYLFVSPVRRYGNGRVISSKILSIRDSLLHKKDFKKKVTKPIGRQKPHYKENERIVVRRCSKELEKAISDAAGKSTLDYEELFSPGVKQLSSVISPLLTDT